MAGMQRSGRRRLARGITLIEQIAVLAILAVLVCAASPSLAGLLRHGRVQSAQMDFLGALRYARAEAVLHRTRVLFCPTRDRIHCSNENHWEGGWLAGVDRNHDHQPDAAPLRVGRSHSHLLILSSASRRLVTFLPDGSAGGSNLSLLFCTPGEGREALGVVVSNSGRVRGSHPRGKRVASCSQAGASHRPGGHIHG